MVSSLTLRLLAGRDDCSSHGSSTDSGSPQHKRTAAGTIKTGGGVNDKNESSVSGYSADREGPSIYPPFLSINLYSNTKYSTREEPSKCPKRRKNNEMQFAATTVKADLARAAMEFKTIDKDIERSTILKEMDINFKDRVQLVHSGDISGPLLPPSNIGRKSTVTDYAALISAASGFYSSKSTRMSDIKSFERTLPRMLSTRQNTWSEPSTSSVSDALCDSGSDNTNSPVPSISPLLEDSLDPSSTQAKKRNKTQVDTSNDISFISNAITMTEILQLSKTARVVTNSSAPYSIIHANAAFHRLSGKKATDAVIGESFFSLLDPEANPSGDNMSLFTYMMSSSKGDDRKLYLLPKTSDGSTSYETTCQPVKCTIRVSPVLDQKTEINEPLNVGYFAIEFASHGKKFDETSFINHKSSSSFSNTNTPMGVVA